MQAKRFYPYFPMHIITNNAYRPAGPHRGEDILSIEAMRPPQKIERKIKEIEEVINESFYRNLSWSIQDFTNKLPSHIRDMSEDCLSKTKDMLKKLHQIQNYPESKDTNNIANYLREIRAKLEGNDGYNLIVSIYSFNADLHKCLQQCIEKANSMLQTGLTKESSSEIDCKGLSEIDCLIKILTTLCNAYDAYTPYRIPFQKIEDLTQKIESRLKKNDSEENISETITELEEILAKTPQTTKHQSTRIKIGAIMGKILCIQAEAEINDNRHIILKEIWSRMNQIRAAIKSYAKKTE